VRTHNVELCARLCRACGVEGSFDKARAKFGEERRGAEGTILVEHLVHDIPGINLLLVVTHDYEIGRSVRGYTLISSAHTIVNVIDHDLLKLLTLDGRNPRRKLGMPHKRVYAYMR
jgi:hypothetical protein